MKELVQVDGRILDVAQEERLRFSHVVKHLYARVQRWDLAIAELHRDMRGRALRAGCSTTDLRPGWQWNRVCEACRALVLSDHVRLYLPAVIHAVVTGGRAGNFCVVETRQGRRELIVGDNAVQVLLRTPEPDGTQAFVTAYRDPPSTSDVTNADFHRRAVRKLRDKASLGSGDKR